MRGKVIKGVVTVVGAITLSTLGIFASDALRGIDGNLASLGGKSGVCPSGMVPMKNGTSVLCIDMYEASPSKNCPHVEPRSALDTEENVTSDECYAASVSDAAPWRFVSLTQAQRVCAGAGKRLPTSDEWYRAALGTDASLCVIRGGAASKTGTEGCISTVGVHDAVGNVWEWVDESVSGYSFQDQTLPSEGYVDSVDAGGVAITSGEKGNEQYGLDYFWSKEEGIFGMIRGGFYGSGDDAGLYTVNAAVETTFTTQGVGFRCVEDVF